MSKIVDFTKQELHEVLQLATSVKVAFAASDIPDAVHKGIASAFAELQAIKKTTSVPFGKFLKLFADKHAPVVAAAVAEPVVEEAPKEVVKPTKKAKADPVVEAPVVEAPVAETQVVEAEPVVEAPAVDAAEKPAE